MEEDIPNSGYYEFGEGKYINLPEDQAKSIKLQGTDIGTFTFESQKVIPSGTATTTYYIEIPVTPQTVAEITFDTTTHQSKLNVDVNGDGVTDFIVAPQADFDPVLYLQMIKKTIDSLDLSQSQKNNFDKKIDRIIPLVKKGKIDRAKTKIENMSKMLVRKLAQPTPKNLKAGKLSKTDAQLLLDMLNQLLDNIK